jgi:predicted SprT family Zn-dependent metalloprotease
MKHTCSECPRVAKSLIPVTKELNGTITYICKQCWARLKFGDYISEGS